MDLTTSVREAKEAFRHSQGRTFGEPSVSMSLEAHEHGVFLKLFYKKTQDQDLNILIAIQNFIIEMKRSGNSQRSMFKRYEDEFVKPNIERVWKAHFPEVAYPDMTKIEDKAQLMLGIPIAEHFRRIDPTVVYDSTKKNATIKVIFPYDWDKRETGLQHAIANRHTSFDVDVTKLKGITDASIQWSLFCKKVFHADRLWFILDANKMNNDDFCSVENKVFRYEGLFKRFDAATPNVNTNMEGGFPKSRAKTAIELECLFDERKHENVFEKFVPYGLTQLSGQLFGLPQFKVEKEKEEYHIAHGQEITLKDLNRPEDLRGMNLFHRALMQLYKMQQQTEESKSAIQKCVHYDLTEGAFKILAVAFGIQPKRLDNGDMDAYQYFLELTDCKRAGDFLQVQAAYENNRAKGPQERYVFVSTDKIAILQARYMGVPCIWTTCKTATQVTLARFYFGSTQTNDEASQSTRGGSKNASFTTEI
jgi:hypothetical protein